MALSSDRLILAADVGGTKTNIALLTVRGGQFRPLMRQSFPSRRFAGLAAIVTQCLNTVGRTRRRLSRACFGVAGPVVHGVCQGPNLPWTVDLRTLRSALDTAAVDVINDVEATAYGIERLPSTAILTLHAGHSRAQGNRALIAAGTGLGESILVWDGRSHRPSASEGGHADFAPRSPLEMDLLRWLWRDRAHVSVERVVSGPGLVRIYRFFRARSRADEPSWLTAALRHGDAAAVISAAGLARRDACCRQALELFASVYGAETGNLALKALATGGVYVGGGIAPKIAPLLRRGGFLRALLDKGRMRRLLSGIPVRVLLDEETALWGAARYAWLQLQRV